VAPLTPARRLGTLLAACVAQFMLLCDLTIVNVALPSIQSELGVTAANLQWVVNAYVVVLAALILVGGTLGDRFGRRRLLLAGFVIFTLASAACALAEDDPQLVAFRAVQGVGAALMAPLALAIIVDAYPPERRPWAIGIWAAVAGIGFGAGPILGGVLIAAFDWSAIFWVNVPMGVLGLVLTRGFVRESRDPTPRPLDLPGAVLAAGALLRWRRPEARLLVALACAPQTTVAYEALPLCLVPEKRSQAFLIAALSQLVFAAQRYVGETLTPPGVTMPMDTFVAYVDITGDLMVALLYLPCLIMVLRRPNEGPVPAWAERAARAVAERMPRRRPRTVERAA
jgi:MFS family permease